MDNIPFQIQSTIAIPGYSDAVTKYRYRFNSLMLELGWPFRLSYIDRKPLALPDFNRLSPTRVWLLTVGIFYVVWLTLVILTDGWATLREHWPIAFSMALGSYAAGSTPMGGGTVGFPVLVMLFELPATMGRDFSFAIQSVGMTSASLYILLRRQPLAWAMLEGAIFGSIIGTPLGIIFIAPSFPELWITVLFGIIWASFGIIHLVRIKQFSQYQGLTDLGEMWDFKIGLLVALFSSLFISSVTGVGIDMMMYSALVLLCKSDLKIAIPTSVIIMAVTSLIAMITKWWVGGFQPGVYENWLAAAPVVVLGAPLGVFIANKIGRKISICVVAVLCIAQYGWMCIHEFDSLGFQGVVISALFVGVFVAGFEWLRRSGDNMLVRSD